MVHADYQGAFVTTWQCLRKDDCIKLDASGDRRRTELGLQAEVLFTDSPKVGSVTVAAQVGTATYGSAGSVTYVVTVNRGSGSGSNGSFTREP
jgi:hypothetical protein